MKKMMVAATLACAMLTATIAGAQQKATKEMPKVEQKTDKKEPVPAKEKAAKMPKANNEVVKKSGPTKSAKMNKKSKVAKK